MWLLNSSIGRKVVMSVTGLALIFFLLFHSVMNLVAVFSKDGYDWICHFLGTNAIVQFIVPILALLFIVHIVYSIILTLQNRRARGNDRYALSGKSEVQWTSKNMFVLGVVVVGGILWHLTHFWYKMQWQEWIGSPSENGFELMSQLFANPLVTILYIVWFAFIWLHLTHGFWSALQTLGWSNDLWYKRLRTIGTIFASLIFLFFTFVAVAFYLKGAGVWESVGAIWHLGGKNLPIM